MALLPDPATAGLAAVGVFLIALGVLVIFVETVRLTRFLLVVIACLALSALLTVLGEFGVALLPLGLGGAFIANQVFEWLTTR